MHWSMKGTLYILSLLLLISCSTHNSSKKTEKFDALKHLDSIFIMAHNWTGDKPPISLELIKKLNSNLKEITIHPINNSLEPNTLMFSAQNKNQLDILKKTPTIQRLNKVSYESYTVWRSIIKNKEILEFSLQPHPTLMWTFTIRKRSQE